MTALGIADGGGLVMGAGETVCACVVQLTSMHCTFRNCNEPDIVFCSTGLCSIAVRAAAGASWRERIKDEAR